MILANSQESIHLCYLNCYMSVHKELAKFLKKVWFGGVGVCILLCFEVLNNVKDAKSCYLGLRMW